MRNGGGGGCICGRGEDEEEEEEEEEDENEEKDVGQGIGDGIGVAAHHGGARRHASAAIDDTYRRARKQTVGKEGEDEGRVVAQDILGVPSFIPLPQWQQRGQPPRQSHHKVSDHHKVSNHHKVSDPHKVRLKSATTSTQEPVHAQKSRGASLQPPRGAG